jgi:hypothetical protein
LLLFKLDLEFVHKVLRLYAKEIIHVLSKHFDAVGGWIDGLSVLHTYFATWGLIFWLVCYNYVPLNFITEALSKLRARQACSHC